MKTSIQMLHLEDSPRDAELIRDSLAADGLACAVVWVDTREKFEAALADERGFDLILCDYNLPDFDGMSALVLARERQPAAPVIMVSGSLNEEQAVRCLHLGATDYLLKQRLDRLPSAVRRALTEAEKHRALQRTEQALAQFKHTLDQTLDSVFMFRGDDFHFIYVNEGAKRQVGYTEAELLGMTPLDFKPEFTLESFRQLVQPLVDGTQPSLFFQTVHRHKDGHDFPVELFLQFVRKENQEPRFVAIVRDITARRQAEAALREREARLRAIVDNEPECVKLVDKDGLILEMNPAGLRIIEADSLPQAQNQSIDSIIVEEHRAAFHALLGKILRGESGTLEFDIIGLKGTRRTLDTHAVPLRDASDTVTSMLGITRDITERKATEARIVYLNRVYAMLSGINTLIVRVRDRDDLFREACRIAVEAGGFRMAWIGIVDRSVMKIVPVASVGVDDELLTALKDRFSSSEGTPLGNTIAARVISEKKAVVTNDLQSIPTIVFKRKYAESGIGSMAIFPLIVSDEAVGVLALCASESKFFYAEEMKLLTELAGDVAFAIDHIEKAEKLNYLAYYDVLTGLANRSLFLERVAQYMRSAVSGGHKLALYLIDLERFKNINDSLGRPAGDALLRQVAEWLTRKVGDANLLARVDADHFAVVLPEVKQDGDAARFLEKTVEAFLEHPFRLNDAVFRIAAKVGIVLFPDDGADADTLFKNAEAALKKAKAIGERYLFYTQKMTETVAGKLTLENQLRQALDKGEFVLHYQPKVNLGSGKLTGAEALIRWNDPRTGLVPPVRFIPILEETGLITEVGRWALRKALEDTLRWRAAGLAAVRIAVNVSPLQLRNRGFIAEVEQAIGIDVHAAAGLELEITESLIMEDVRHNIASLQAIRALGISIAIDDFGTGFSSLSYLAKLPVDTLKIDRSFVIDMTAGPEGLALVSTIINLAHSLKLKVVAEGVETEEQSRLLRLLRCDEMQGFLFSKPVPSEIFETRFLAPPPAG